MIRYFRDDLSLRRAFVWLAAFAVVGASLVLLYRDADQQDSGYHFLFARWAHRHPQYFIGVWARPLFTLLYFPFAQFGYAAAKFFTVIISLAAAWQTFRLARQIKFDRAEIAIPLLFLQPSFFLLSSTVLTETLFALAFVIALRLHLSGRIKAGMIVASLLILIRPEGFFIGMLWGLWVLFGAEFGILPSRNARFEDDEGRKQKRQKGQKRQKLFLAFFALFAFFASISSDLKRAFDHFTRTPKQALKAVLQTLILSTGLILWWLAAYLIMRDPLWIIHDWPPDWRPDGKAYGTGPIWWYVALLPLIAGPLLIAPFIAGLWRLLKRREFMCGVSAFLVLFVAHSLMFWRGWFGSAGYARYFVCVSPAIALIALAGWNHLAERRISAAGGSERGPINRPIDRTSLATARGADSGAYSHRSKFFGAARKSLAAIALAASFLICVFYVDSWKFTRDARAVDEMFEWFRANERPVSRLICSQAYMWIVFDRDQGEQPPFTADREGNLALIRQSPPRTLVFWDDETGPKWYGLRAGDFESAGYVRLKSQAFRLEGLFFRLARNGFGGPRVQHMSLLYKDGANR
jgi:hypothetical protein